VYDIECPICGEPLGSTRPQKYCSECGARIFQTTTDVVGTQSSSSSSSTGVTVDIGATMEYGTSYSMNNQPKLVQSFALNEKNGAGATTTPQHQHQHHTIRNIITNTNINTNNIAHNTGDDPDQVMDVPSWSEDAGDLNGDMPGVIGVGYADGCCERALIRCRESALQSGFNHFAIYHRNDLPRDLLKVLLLHSLVAACLPLLGSCVHA
jgi:hypothetical protein